LEVVAYDVDQFSPGAGGEVALGFAVVLAWGAGVDGVEPFERVVECVGLPELEWVPGLGFDVYADDVEPGLVVAHRGTASAAEQVEQPGPGHWHFEQGSWCRSSNMHCWDQTVAQCSQQG
jgi:hypothetical protein